MKQITLNELNWTTENSQHVIYDIETIYDPQNQLNGRIIAIGFYNVELEEMLILHLDLFKDHTTFYNHLRQVMNYLSRMELIIIGWNSYDFDYPHLVTQLGLKNKYGYVLKPKKCHHKVHKQLWGQFVYNPNHIDAMVLLFMHYKKYNLASYSLKYVSEFFKVKHSKKQINVAPHKLYFNIETKKLFMEYLEHDLLAVHEILKHIQAYKLIHNLIQIGNLETPTQVMSSLSIADCLFKANNVNKQEIKNWHLHDPAITNNGGYNLKTKAGVYDDVYIFDFKSQYPTIMKELQITQSLSDTIEMLMTRRQEFKSNNDRNSEQAIKIITNSIYGAFDSQYFKYNNNKIAAITTYIGRLLIIGAVQIAKKQGYNVVMTSTDSIFLQHCKNIENFTTKINKYSNYVLIKMREYLQDSEIDVFRSINDDDIHDTIEIFIKDFEDNEYKTNELKGFLEYEAHCEYIVKQAEAKQYIKFYDFDHYEIVGVLKNPKLPKYLVSKIIQKIKQKLNYPNIEPQLTKEDCIEHKKIPKHFDLNSGGKLAHFVKSSLNRFSPGDDVQILGNRIYNMDPQKNKEQMPKTVSESDIRIAKERILKNVDKYYNKFGFYNHKQNSLFNS